MSRQVRSISAKPTLRLVRPASDVDRAWIQRHREVARENRLAAEAELNPNDARWVLAIRAAHALEGAQLRPERREKLVRLATTLGMRPFDANLVIALVQDRARRGEITTTRGAGLPDDIADALAMVPSVESRRSQERGTLASPAVRWAVIVVLSVLWAVVMVRLLLGSP
jgi:hypothetical protein